MTRILLVLTFTLCCLACGGDHPSTPISPSPPPPAPTPTPLPPPPVTTIPQIAGTWLGTGEQQFRGIRTASFLRLTLTQQDRVIRGSWQYTSPGWESWRGEIQSGALAGSGDTATFAGVVGIISDTGTGTGACFGTMVMSGPTSARSMRWTADHIDEQNCANSTKDIGGFVWILTR